MNCTRALVKWCKRYHVGAGKIFFEGYTDLLPDDIGGRCYYTTEPSGRRTAEIEMPNKV